MNKGSFVILFADKPNHPSDFHSFYVNMFYVTLPRSFFILLSISWWNMLPMTHFVCSLYEVEYLYFMKDNWTQHLSLEYIYLPKVLIFATGVEMKARKYTQFKKLCNKHFIQCLQSNAASIFTSLCAKFLIRNMKSYLKFRSFLHNDMTRVVGIQPRVRKGLACFTKPIS